MTEFWRSAGKAVRRKKRDETQAKVWINTEALVKFILMQSRKRQFLEAEGHFTSNLFMHGILSRGKEI